MRTRELVPIDGCWVRKRGPDTRLGRVVAHQVDGADRVAIDVDWGASRREWVPLTELRSGIQRDWTVQDVPLSATRRSLGTGRVVGHRQLGGREQVLIQLDDDGRSVWLPYENLRRVKDVRIRYVRAETGPDDHPQRFRLRLLAHALDNWNQLTGSLDRLDVDPLPHQIQLVHRILTSGNYDWLIADDVGLGKTIEVGLLLAALRRAGRARRVLIVCPAGLTRQWQDELRYKFDQEYLIYGTDVSVNNPKHWKIYDRVIVSIDRAKLDTHVELFRQAGSWDVVVFDEGHKLTRHASGERAQRYRLAEALRPQADAFLLLSGNGDRLHADILGDVLESLDMAEILRNATSLHLGRTEQEIEAAIARAKAARELQEEILAHAAGYDPEVLRGTLGFSMRHVELFVRGMLPFVGAEVEAESYKGEVLQVRLPERLRGEFREFGQRTVVRMTTNRRMAQRLPDVALLDFEGELFQYLIAVARSPEFDGIYASVSAQSVQEGTVAVYGLRWQNDQGDALSEELVTVFRDGGGELVGDPAFLVKWIESAPTGAPLPVGERAQRAENFDAIEEYAQRLLATESTRFKHPNGLVRLAAADFRSGE